jgi:Asp/Glu/hydantoin racemase
MRKVVFVHASRAAVEPLMRYYPKEAPDLEITNLLDDGVMRLFRGGGMDKAKVRLAEMIRTGREVYAAEASLLTCSAVPTPVLAELRALAGIPLVKIDVPMTRLAVRAARRIGIVVTFPPTVESTRALLLEASPGVELSVKLVPEALDRLLAGDAAAHDEMLLDAGAALADGEAEALVLAQVSMAHLVAPMRARTGRPVFSSLETSLAALREALG